jgi:hypothetical protein
MTPHHELMTEEFYPRSDGIERVVITKRLDGGPIRLITHGRQHKVVGRYYSVKNGGTRAWESRPELHDMYRAEVSWDVVHYYHQPETLVFNKNGRRHQYTPDRLDVLADGSRRYVEVKDDQPVDPAEIEKLEDANRIYGWLGYKLDVVTRLEIEREPHFSAARSIQSRARCLVDGGDVQLVSKLFAERNSVALAEVCKALGAKGLPGACALAVHRTIAIDLSTGLVDDASVSLRGRGYLH